MNISSIFNLQSNAEFENLALDIFRLQVEYNQVYKEFCLYLGKTPANVKTIAEIPFLPIEFFKTKKVVSNTDTTEVFFTSSGTTGSNTSTHNVSNIAIYQQSYLTCFEQFYGPVKDFCILALLPSYLERKGSSLVYMVDDLIQKSNHPDSGFYLDEFESLNNKLKRLDAKGSKVLLIGVSFALLDFVEKYPLKLNNTTILETGGMKGRRKELIREELHHSLQTGFGADTIHSEYGMTELLSQAYSDGNGLFRTPPWMKVLIRDTEDPLCIQSYRKTGGLNVIDLANINSCSFIATQDLGKQYEDGSFEILGRFDHSDIRGCNLLLM